MGNKFIWILMAMLSIIGGVLALMNPVFASGLATIIVAWMFIIFGALQVIAGFRVEGAGAAC